MIADACKSFAAQYQRLTLPELDLPTLDRHTILASIDNLVQLRRALADMLHVHLLDLQTKATLQRLDIEIAAQVALYQRFTVCDSALDIDAILNEPFSDNDTYNIDALGLETGSIESRSSTSTTPFTITKYGRRYSTSHLLSTPPPISSPQIRHSDQHGSNFPPYAGPVLAENLEQYRDSLSQAIDPYDPFYWTPLQQISDHAYSPLVQKRYGTLTFIRVEKLIAIGTSSGCVLLYDSNQVFRCALGSGSIEKDHGSVTAIDINKRQSHILVGYTTGHVCVFELSRNTLLKAITPLARSVIAQGSEHHGHMHGTRIIHVAFLGRGKSRLVTADNKGLAFYHRLHQSVLIYRVETFRLFGSYKNKLNLSSLTTIFALKVFPATHIEHLTNDMNLVTILTPFKMVIASVKDTIKTLFRLPRNQTTAPYLGTKAIGSGCLALHPATEHCDPLIAVSWSNWLGIYIIQCNRAGTKLDVQLVGQFTSEWRIMSLHFLTAEIMVIHNAEDQFQLLDLNKVAIIETSQVRGRGIMCQDSFTFQLKQLGAEVADMSFSGSIQAAQEKLFILTSTHIFCSALTQWQQRIRAMVNANSAMLALQVLQALYDYQDTGFVLVGLPVNVEDREKAVRGMILEVIDTSTSLLVASYSTDAHNENGIVITDSNDRFISGGSNSTSYNSRALIASLIDVASLIRRTDILFGSIYHRLNETALYPIFYDVLSDYILLGTVTDLPVEIAQALIKHQLNKEEDHTRLSQIMLHLNVTSLNTDWLRSICKEHALWKPMFYIYACGMSNYTDIPTIALQQLTINAFHDQQQVMVVLFEYLESLCTRNGWFASRVSSVDDAFASVTTWLLNTSNLSTLLMLDNDQTVRCLNSLLRDHLLSEGFDIDEEENVDETTNRASHQWIIDRFLSIIQQTPTTLSDKAMLSLLCLVASSARKYRDRVVVPSIMLHEIFLTLTSTQFDAAASRTSREYAVIDLIKLLNIDSVQEREVLKVCEERELWRVCELIHCKHESYDKLIACYVVDSERKSQVMDLIRRLLSSSDLDPAHMVKFQGSIMDHILVLAENDVKGLAEIVCNQWRVAFSRVAQALHGFHNELAFLDASFLHLCNAERERQEHQQQFLEGVISQTNNITSNAGDTLFIERYIELLLVDDPTALPGRLKLLQILMPIQNNEAILQLIMVAQHVEASAWILEQRNQPLDALQQYIEAMYTSTQNLLDHPVESEPSLKQAMNKHSRLHHLAIELCGRSSLTVRSAIRNKMWLQVVDQTLLLIQRAHKSSGEQQKETALTIKLKRALSLTLQSISGHMSLPILLRRIIESQSHSSLGAYRVIIQEMLESYHYEKVLLSTTVRLCQDDSKRVFTRLVWERRKALSTNVDHCTVCFSSVQDTNSTSLQSSQTIIVLACGHILHALCAKNEQLVQIPIESKTRGGSAICPICDLRYRTKSRRSRLAGKGKAAVREHIILGNDIHLPGDATVDAKVNITDNEQIQATVYGDLSIPLNNESLYTRFRDFLSNPDLEDDDNESMSHAMIRFRTYKQNLRLSPPFIPPTIEDNDLLMDRSTPSVRVAGLLPVKPSIVYHTLQKIHM